MFGDLFPTLHVAAVIMHAAMVIILFYRFPKRLFYPESKGFFLKVDSCESDTEKSNDTPSPIPPFRINA